MERNQERSRSSAVGRRATVTTPATGPASSPVLAGWIEQRKLPGAGPGTVKIAHVPICERCSKTLPGTTSAAQARKDLLKHRRECYPRVTVQKKPLVRTK